MRIENIKDRDGKIIGFMEFRDDGDIYVKDFSGRYLGFYDSRIDKTKDFYGRILFQGNMVGALIGLRKDD